MSNYLEAETARKNYAKKIRLMFFIPMTIVALACIPFAFPTYVDYYDVQQQDTVCMRLLLDRGSGQYFKDRKEELWTLEFDTPVDSADLVITMIDQNGMIVGFFYGQLDETGYRGVFESDDTTYDFDFRRDTTINN